MTTDSLPKVMVAHPYYRTGLSMNFYLGMITTIATYPGPLEVKYLGSYSAARARNTLIAHFLTQSDAEYLFFLDVDLGLPAYALKQLVEHKLPVVGALYFERLAPHNPAVYYQDVITRTAHTYVSRRDYQEGLVQVDATGAGALLLHRTVFKQLKKPYFFEPANVDVSEDFYFMEHCKARGIPVYVDTSLVATHQAEILVTEADKQRYDQQF